MSKQTLNFERQITYDFVDCCQCSFPIALPDDKKAALQKNGKTFWCPLCGTGQSWRRSIEEAAEIKRLKESLAWEQTYARDQREARERAEASLSATKGVVTRLKNRSKAGVCPCCNRHFTALERHMATKHPDFTKAEVDEMRATKE